MLKKLVLALMSGAIFLLGTGQALAASYEPTHSVPLGINIFLFILLFAIIIFWFLVQVL